MGAYGCQKGHDAGPGGCLFHESFSASGIAAEGAKGGFAVAVYLPVAHQLIIAAFFPDESKNIFRGIAKKEADLVGKIIPFQDMLPQGAETSIERCFFSHLWGIALLNEKGFHGRLSQILQEHILAIDEQVYPLLAAVEIFYRDAKGDSSFLYVSISF